MEIPLQTKLKREMHRKIAYAQDIVVKEVYSVFSNAVLHGGTAIWRCFNGKRFSEDLDFYLPKDYKNLEKLFANLKNAGFEIVKKKISEKSVYSELALDNVYVRLEAIFQKIKGELSDYKMSNGNVLSIYSLTAEEFVKEKIKTYQKRLKVRDLWDIYFLLQNIKNPNMIKEINSLIMSYQKPLDEENLKTIILEGIIPSADEMINYIKRKWENKYI